MLRSSVRGVLARVAVLALLFLVGTTGIARAAAAPAPVDARVSAALYTPTRESDGIAWSAHWVLTPESADDLSNGKTRALRFAVPLANGERIEPTWGVVPFVEDGRVAGVNVDREALQPSGRVVTAVVHQRVALGGDAVHLGAPVAAGNALQIIDGDLGAGARFEVESGRGLERRVGYVAPPATSHGAREEARRLTGYGASVTGAAVYVRGDDVRSANGISAAVVTPRERSRGTTAAIALLFAAIVAALVYAVRKLHHAATSERSDALLAAEVDALDTVDRGR